MPKLPIPEKLQKSMFWIVVGVLSLFSVIIWWLGTSAVAKMRDADIATINGYFATIGSAAPTANEESVAAIRQQADLRRKSMGDAWQRVYDNQRKEPFWPLQELDANGVLIKPGLPKEFVEAAQKLPPPEWLPSRGDVISEPLAESLKEIYRNYAKRQIADLCAIVGSEHRIAERRGPATSQPATRADASDTAEPGEVCVWVTASQQAAAEMLTFSESGNPSTQDIIYAQGNVWAYQALFNIIRATNESYKETNPKKEPAQHYNAPVKIIHEISIGEKFPVKEEESRPGGAANPDEPEVAIPAVLRRAATRYVNERGKRLKGDELLALGDPKAPDADPSRSYAQYKLAPVFMRLEVDQRFLGRLLVECGNAPLTVEVKDVTFNVKGHADRAAATTDDAAGPNEGPKETKNFYDVPVDITGYIYVYFPPPVAAPAEAAPAEEAPPAEENAADAATPAAAGQ